MSSTLSAELLKEMEDALTTDESYIEDEDHIEVKYEMIVGFRINSMILWAYEEKELYYENAYSTKTKLRGFTCRKKKCNARIYVREDGTAFRDPEQCHRSHGNQYQAFRNMYCDNKMKEKARTAPASMTPYDIYMEVVVELVQTFF